MRLFAKKASRPPRFLRFRSSQRFILFVVAFSLFSDMALYGLIVPVAPFRLSELGYQDVASKTGFLIAAYGAGLIVSSPPVAYLGELTRDRQTGLLAALLCMMGAVVMFMESRKFALLLVARILQGVSGTVIWTLAMALVSDSVDVDQIGPAFGIVMIGFSVGSLIGAPVGGLYENCGYRAPFIFALALCGCDLVLRLVIVEHHRAFKWITPSGRKASDEKEKESFRDAPQAAERFRQLKAVGQFFKSKRAMTSFGISAVNGLVFGGLLDGSMTIYLNARYGLNSQDAGLVFIAALAPSFVTSPLAGRFVSKYGNRWPIIVSCALTVPFVCLLIVPQLPLAAFIVVLTFTGAASTTVLVPVVAEFSFLPAKIPHLGFAHVFGIFNFSFSCGAFVGPLIAGQILGAVGDEKGWQIMAGLSAACYLAVLWPVWLYIPNGPLSEEVVTPLSPSSAPDKTTIQPTHGPVVEHA